MGYDEELMALLLRAVINNEDFSVSKSDLARIGNASLTDGYGNTPLMYAAGTGDLSLVERLIAIGADPRARNRFGGTALHFAAEKGRAETLEVLLAGRALCDIDSFGAKFDLCAPMTPLMLAVNAGNADAAKVLIERGADIEACDGEGRTALAFGLFGERAPIVKMLIEKGAKTGRKLRDGNTLLTSIARDVYPRLEIFEQLAKAGANIDGTDADGRTPLILAVMREFTNERVIALVEYLIEAGANAGIRDKSGKRAIDHARARKHLDLVGIIEGDRRTDAFKKPAPETIKEAGSATAVIDAVSETWPDARKIGELIESGEGSADERDTDGVTPLMICAKKGFSHEKAAALLIKSGARIDDIDGRGMTALMHAAEELNEGMVALLLKSGANTDIIDRDGRSAYSLAAGRADVTEDEMGWHTAAVESSERVTAMIAGRPRERGESAPPERDR